MTYIRLSHTGNHMHYELTMNDFMVTRTEGQVVVLTLSPRVFCRANTALNHAIPVLFVYTPIFGP